MIRLLAALLVVVHAVAASPEDGKLQNGIKRKAVDEISQRSSKIINTGPKEDATQVNFTTQDLANTRKSVYRSKRSILPVLPRSLQDVQEALESVVIKTNKSEDFLLEPLFSFNNGRIGVNFLGYKASAGLGGLLTGNSADGGLFAGAETPHGQRAVAGGGGLAGESGAAGGLFAGAKTGYGQHASAGLGGISGQNSAEGGLFATSGTGYGHRAGAGLVGTSGRGGDLTNSLQNFLNRLFQK